MDKYRLGKKQKRAILYTETGHEYLVFPHGKTEHVSEFLEWLNNREQSRQSDVSGSFDDAKFIDALFGEYNKSYKETKPGQVFPRWLDDEQLKWVITVAKNCC